MAEERDPPPAPAPDDARLARLGAALDARRPPAEASQRGAGSTSGLAQGVRITSEFAAGVLAGSLLGWVLDKLAGTTPWGLIAGVVLGFGAGMMNVLRASGALRDPVKGRDGGAPPRA